MSNYIHAHNPVVQDLLRDLNSCMHAIHHRYVSDAMIFNSCIVFLNIIMHSRHKQLNWDQRYVATMIVSS